MSLMTDVKKVVVIAGAGPAGLTAALELLRRSNATPIVFESAGQVGGISRTVSYQGNRMDLGGHRFFSKSDWVMRWWQQILPVAGGQIQAGEMLRLGYQGQSREIVPDQFTPADPNAVMLVRQRLSRIFHRRRFFDYPLKINAETIMKMGLFETLRIGVSYGRAQISHRRPEESLEDFFINRFGERLYRTFFKEYTEKVWGVACSDISSEWGAQRIKGLSVAKAIAHAIARRSRSSTDTAQKLTETSLIERFLYPKLGPGQMWDEVARRITARGANIHLDHQVVALERDDNAVTAVRVQDRVTGAVRRVACDCFISTMPIRDLAGMLKPDDSRVIRIADRLPYRDFMTAGLLLRRMKCSGAGRANSNGMPPDNWIYIQEPDVRIGRLQIFNNWSPALVSDPDTIWLGLEYFCRQGDDLWSMSDRQFLDFAAKELETLQLIDRRDVLDGTVVRVPKAYPAYFGEYREFAHIREYLGRFSNLYPVGRNGMHRYNNQDHSMLAANGAVTSILDGGRGRAAIWDINIDDSYHEEVA